jgi:5-methyltetrahydrofolate--homocysteine methyltransferase
MPTITSRNGSIEYGEGHPTLLINDQLFIIDQVPRMLEEVSNGKVDMMVDMARWGKQVGLDIPAILINHPEIDEVEMLPKIAVAVHNEVGCPIGLDSRHPEALQAACEALQPYRPVIFTVTAEDEILSAMLPIVKRYQAVIAGMPMGRFSTAVPMTVEGRLAETRIIINACEGYGIPREDIVIDAICMAVSTLLPESYHVSLETIKAVKNEFGVAIQLGVSNAGHGMPDPTSLELAYLIGAMSWGLDAAFINPATIALIQSVRAMDMLTERDTTGKMYLQQWRSLYGKSSSRRKRHEIP